VNGMPFTRTAPKVGALATRHWPIWGAPFGPARKWLSALLCSLELATASSEGARLAANRFLTGCFLRYFIEGVLTVDYFTRVHYVMRIEGLFNRLHRRNRAVAMFIAHVLEFADTDAMLAGTGATHVEGALNQAFIEF